MLNSVFAYYFRNRLSRIKQMKNQPYDLQEKWLKELVQKAGNTEFGNTYRFKDIRTLHQFQEQVPIHSYEKIFPFIERQMRGEKNVLWPGGVEWFSKSSGTTNARSKYIPITSESLNNCHFLGGLDLYTLYVLNFPNTKIWKGKGLAIGGSHELNMLDPIGKSRIGDISGVIIQNAPAWVSLLRASSLEVSLLSNWEEKIKRMAEETVRQDVTHLAGVPTWTSLLLQYLIQHANKNSIDEIWPRLEVFFHGAVSFVPYRGLFQSFIKNPNMNYWETYNASEGFFGIQDVPHTEDMLLLVDHGVFYEFIPMDEMEKEHPQPVDLSGVKVGENYALVISTNGGLWRYLIGDTVKFTNINPFRIKITGRTKHFINAFGEEVIIENAEVAIAKACEKTDAVITNYTAAPVFLERNKRGGHEWIVEFRTPPTDSNLFIEILDSTLRDINSDYDAKRTHDLALVKPIVHIVKPNTFYNWMKQRGKLGGQNKVPRLSNSREYVEELLKTNA